MKPGSIPRTYIMNLQLSGTETYGLIILKRKCLFPLSFTSEFDKELKHQNDCFLIKVSNLCDITDIVHISNPLYIS